MKPDMRQADIATLPRSICAVYFLFQGDALTYIGASTDLRRRLSQHQKTFDGFCFVNTAPGCLRAVEIAAILEHNPRENVIRAKTQGRKPVDSFHVRFKQPESGRIVRLAKQEGRSVSSMVKVLTKEGLSLRA